MKTALLLLLLAGCSNLSGIFLTDEETQRLDGLLEGQAVSSPQGLTLALGESFRASLDSRIAANWSDAKKLRELRAYLFDEEELGISYAAEVTRTAAEALAARSGNCLSLTSLFVAAARHVGLDSHFQTVAISPTWDKRGSVMIRYEHIVAVGKLKTGRDYVVDFLPGFSADDNKTSTIKDQTALAHYYNNLGAELVVDGDHEAAIAHALKAIKLEPELSNAWNNLGAAYRRSNQIALAELSYKRALIHGRNNYSALGNLTQLYLTDGRRDEAETFMHRVNRYHRRNPYFQFYLAQLLYQAGDFEAAKVRVEVAIRLKSDDPNFHAALGDVNQRLGLLEEAEKARQKARALRGNNPDGDSLDDGGAGQQSLIKLS